MRWRFSIVGLHVIRFAERSLRTSASPGDTLWVSGESSSAALFFLFPMHLRRASLYTFLFRSGLPSFSPADLVGGGGSVATVAGAAVAQGVSSTELFVSLEKP